MDTGWKSLEKVIHPAVMKGIAGFKFRQMTAVQAACIPQLVSYKDVAAEAVTGSGKTLAFLVPVLHILLRRDDPWKSHEIGAIIIAPTRELAFQINQVLSELLKEIPNLTQLLFIGGTSIHNDVQDFIRKGGNIIIATPGRFEDLLLRREDSRIALAVKYLEVLILDEADCLLNLGFEKSLNTILRILPKQRRTGLFSATQTTEVLKLIRAGLRNPVSVVVRDNDNQGRVPSTLENFYCVVEPQTKFHLLVEFIKQEIDASKKLLIFFSTCACVEFFSLVLKQISVVHNLSKIMSMHGKMKEKNRLAVFSKFRDSATGVLCCTDVLARGIDITGIEWVIQFDPPSNPASFIHRAGRTARNGVNGQSLLVLQPSEIEYVDYIKVSQKVDVAPLSLTHLETNVSNQCDWSEFSRKLQLDDRKFFDKAMRAFVSYYKAYSKYDCHLILRHKDLKLGRIAESFGLIKFPKMSELHGKKPPDFEESDVDINSIPYCDVQREKARLKKLQIFKETGKWVESSKSTNTTRSITRKKNIGAQESWSKAKDKKLKKREKKITKKRKRNALTVEEFEELEKDDALVRKLKNRKISDTDFVEKIGITMQDDD